ncbi:hypothetical protein phiOC_p307 [Ochrobactrum phage vB_OspM_OC]|nr:hypothetical protein phiOC_p307 [Ochrobactrum phage vB_OspM_OC]
MFYYNMSFKCRKFFENSGLSESQVINHCNQIVDMAGLGEEDITILFTHTYNRKFKDSLNGSAIQYDKDNNVYRLNIVSNFYHVLYGLFKGGFKHREEAIIYMIAHEIAHFKQYHEKRLNNISYSVCCWDGKYYNTKTSILASHEYMTLPWEYEANKIAVEYCRGVFGADFSDHLESISHSFCDIEYILEGGPKQQYAALSHDEVFKVVVKDFERLFK